MASLRCCVHDCRDSAGGRRYYAIPTGNPNRLEEWCARLLIKINSPDLSTLRVCNKHFSPAQYELFEDNKRLLRANAVPDCSLPKIKQEEPPKERNVDNDGFNPPVLMVDNLDRVCRMCLELDEHGTFESIFANEEIVDYIQQSIGIEIQQAAGYPSRICATCIDRVTYIHRSREWFHKNDQLINTIVGELSEKVSPASEDQSDVIIIPDEIPLDNTNATLKEEAELAQGTNIFTSGTVIAAEEVTLDQLGMVEHTQSESGTDRPRRKRQCVTKSKPPTRKSVQPTRTVQLYKCHCGVSYLQRNGLNTHIAKVHGDKSMGGGNKSRVPPKPLVLEEMAAVFNSMTMPLATAAVDNSEQPPGNTTSYFVANRPKQ